MNCPTCGAPNVMLHGTIWECGWCGDFGDIPRRILEERAAAQRTKSLEDVVIQLKFVPCEDTDEPEEEPFCDPEVEALVRAFPQELSDWSAEELREINSGWLLYGVYKAAPQTAIAMWRSLLPSDMDTDTLSDSRAAEDFVFEMELVWLDAEGDRGTLLPVLDAMERDDSLARLVFQSAYVGYPQLNLLRDAVYAGRAQQAAHLFALLQANPLPRSQWAEDLSEFQEAMTPPSKTEVSAPHHEERMPPNVKVADAKPCREEKPVQEQKADAPKPQPQRREDTVQHGEQSAPKPAPAVKAPPAEPAPETRSRKALRIAAIAGCLALVGLLIGSAVQSVPETRPKVEQPVGRPAITTPAAPEPPAKDTAPSAAPGSSGQTFNYGGGSVDTGPGSGSSLREDYDDPEDLYEDGDYDDLDEAWDEWEEGW